MRSGHEKYRVDLPCGERRYSEDTDAVDITDQEVDVVVVVQPRLKSEPAADTPEARGWLPGFFEKTAGAWQGDPLTRPPQGKYEIRGELK